MADMNKIKRIDGGVLKTQRAQDATIPLNVQTYDGSYTVTPTREQQTLATRNRMMTNDVTVEAAAITTDYDELENKPQINSVTLQGNVGLDELGIPTIASVEDKYTVPEGGIPASDLASGVIPDVSGFYTKPSGGIPADDIADGVIPDVSGKLDAPSVAGTLGQVLTSDGEGGQTWEDPAGGTTDYTDLDNKPQINSVTLTGNKSLSDLGIAAAADLSDKQAKITASGILKGDGSGGVTAATAGTDYGTYSKPSGGIPSTDMASAVQTSLGKADTAYQKPSGGIPSTDLASAVQTSLGKADTAYQKPSGGIPSTDIATGVIPDVSGFYTKPSGGIPDTDIASASTWNGKYAKPSGGIPSTDLASAVQTSLGKADSAYQKPSGGIPGTDLASGVIPDISGKLDAPSTAGTEGQVLTAHAQENPTWEDAAMLPSGGETGTFLVKNSSTDYDTIWQKVPPLTQYYDPEWGTYAVGDYCIYDGILFRCKVAISTPEAFNSQHWQATFIADDVATKYTKPQGGIPASDLASGVIPDVSGKLDKPSTAGTNGQVLTSNGSGGQTWQTISGLLPSVSSGDNGKFLRVSNGAWAAETVPTAVGVSF